MREKMVIKVFGETFDSKGKGELKRSVELRGNRIER